jgi:hypothetical protein
MRLNCLMAGYVPGTAPTRVLPPPDFPKSILVPRTGYDAIYLSSTNKDTTVHLEVDIVVDVEDELESLNRLMRMGDFRNAKTLL